MGDLMKANGYARFSSDEQKNGNSIARQTQNIEDYCHRNGLSLSETLRLKFSIPSSH
jgi:DNA invertase Pin-like site-specific DNA recombinase